MGAVATLIWTSIAGFFAERGISKAIKYLAKNPTKKLGGVAGGAIGYQISKNERYINLALLAGAGYFLVFYAAKKKGK